MTKIINWFLDEKGNWCYVEIEIMDDLNFNIRVDGVDWQGPKNIGDGLLDFSEMNIDD